MGWVGPALGGGAAAAVGGQGDRPDDEQRAPLPPARVHRRGEAAAPRRGESRIELETKVAEDYALSHLRHYAKRASTPQ